MGRRELRGVDGALYAPGDEIWSWEAVADSNAVVDRDPVPKRWLVPAWLVLKQWLARTIKT